MKFMGWFLNTLRPVSVLPVKDLTIGSNYTKSPVELCTDDEEYYTKRNLVSSKCSIEHSKRVDKRFPNGTEILHDFLTIGTLGSQTIFTESFSMQLNTISETEEMTVNDLHVTDNEVKLQELARNGHKVSTVRTQCDTNDLHSMKIDVSLEGYLPGRIVQWPETIVELENVKLSSREVQQDAKVEKKHSGGKYYKEDMQETKTRKSAKHYVKRMLKKLCTVKCSTLSSAHDFVSPPTTKQLNQAMKISCRKVHPENSSVTSKFENCHVSKVDQIANDGDPDTEELNTSRSRERWIRTENYLVLEL